MRASLMKWISIRTAAPRFRVSPAAIRVASGAAAHADEDGVVADFVLQSAGASIAADGAR